MSSIKTFISRNSSVLHKAEFYGFLIALTFFLILSYYNLLMLESYNYTIFDLGLNYRTMFLFHTNYHLLEWPNPPLITPLTYSKLIYVPLSLTLYINDTAGTLLLDQIFVISLGGYSLFRIAGIKTGSTLTPFVVELCYFLYSATYGFMTQGGNFVVFFEGFFLLGYFLYLIKKPTISFIAFLFASISNVFAPGLIVLFFLVDFGANRSWSFSLRYFVIKKSFYKVIQRIKDRTIRWKLSLVIAILVLESALSLFFIVKYGISGIFGAARLSMIGTSTVAMHYSIGALLNQVFKNMGSYKFNFLNQIFSPVLYVTALTPYALLVFLFIAVAWYSNQTIYYGSLNTQYSSLFAAFVFIGFVHFFKGRIKHNDTQKIFKRLLVLVLVSSIVSFLIYSPFSLENIQSGNVSKYADVTPFDKDLTHGLSLIPNNATVYIQNILPQMMNRKEVYMPGYYSGQPVDYAVIIPFSFSYLSQYYGGYDNTWAMFFEHNTSYGLYENISGALVYKLNYIGPVIYQPSLTAVGQY